MQYQNWKSWRWAIPLLGASAIDKLRLLLVAILEVIPREDNKILPHWLDSMRQRVADRIASGIVIQLEGIKYVLVDSESLWILCPFNEKWLSAQLLVNQRRVFLDVGAHVGKHSFPMAKRLKRGIIISIEAHPKNFLALKRGIELNGFTNVIPINVAAWNEKCRIKLYIGNRAGWHSLKKREYGQALRYITVNADRLDAILRSLNIAKVDLIKIDVEGAELEVLQGLEQSLKLKPELFVETFHLEEDVSFLSRFGYVHKGNGYFSTHNSKDVLKRV